MSYYRRTDTPNKYASIAERCGGTPATAPELPARRSKSARFKPYATKLRTGADDCTATAPPLKTAPKHKCGCELYGFVRKHAQTQVARA